MVKLQCGHIFHRPCLIQLRDAVCPLCRARNFPRWLRRKIAAKKPIIMFNGRFESREYGSFRAVLKSNQNKRKGTVSLQRVHSRRARNMGFDVNEEGNIFSFEVSYTLRTNADIKDLIESVCKEYVRIRTPAIVPQTEPEVSLSPLSI